MKHDRSKVLIAFKKGKSLLEKVIQMTEEDKYCIEIMQQNLAIIGLLKSAHRQLMEDHLNSCFREAFKSKSTKKQQRMIDEILKVNDLYNR